MDTVNRKLTSYYSQALNVTVPKTVAPRLDDFIVDSIVPTGAFVSYIEVVNDGERKLVVPLRYGDCIYDVYYRAFDPNVFNFEAPTVHPHVLRDIFDILRRDIYHSDQGLSALVNRKVNGVMLLCDVQHYINNKAPSKLSAALGMFCHLLASDIEVESKFVKQHGMVHLFVENKYYTKLCYEDDWNDYISRNTIEQHMDPFEETPSVSRRIVEYTADQLSRMPGYVSSTLTSGVSSATSFIFESIKSGIRGLVDGIYSGVAESTFNSDLKNAMNNAAEKISKVLVLVITTFVVYKIATATNLTRKLKENIIPMVYSISSGIITYQLSSQVIRELFHGSPGVEQHDGKVSPSSLLGAALGLGIISFLNTDEKGNTFSINNHVTKLSKVASMILVTGTLLNEVDVTQWLTLLPNCIQAWFNPETTPSPQTTVSYMLEDIAKTRRAVNTTKRATVIAYITSVDKLLAFLMIHPGLYKSDSPFYTSLRSIVRDVETFRTYFGQGTVNRRRAFWIYLWTDTPGTGKSVVADTIAQMINHHVYDNRYSKEDLVYPRNDTKYWDRYYHQPIVIVDDLASKTDCPRTPEFINLCSDLPYTLDMASIDNPVVGQKGTCFSSEVVISTTNSFNPTTSVANLSNKGAWLSRRSLCIENLFCDPAETKLLTPSEFKKLYFLDDRLNMDKAFTHFQNRMSRVDFDYTLPMMRFRLYSNSLTSHPKRPVFDRCYTISTILPLILNAFVAFRNSPLATGQKDPSKFRFRRDANGKFATIAPGRRLVVPKLVVQNADTDDDENVKITTPSINSEETSLDEEYDDFESEDDNGVTIFDYPLGTTTVTTSDDFFPLNVEFETFLDSLEAVPYPSKLSKNDASEEESSPLEEETSDPIPDEDFEIPDDYQPTQHTHIENMSRARADRIISTLSSGVPPEDSPFTDGVGGFGVPVLDTYVVQNQFTSLYKAIDWVCKTVALVGGLFVVSKVAYDLYNSFQGDEIDLQSAHRERNVKARRPVVVQKGAQSENEVKQFLYKNCGSVCVNNGNGTFVFKGSCFGYSNYILFPRHFLIRSDYTYLLPGTEIKVRVGPSSPVTFKFYKEECKFFFNDDKSYKDIVAYPMRQMTFKTRKSICPKESVLTRHSLGDLCVGSYQYEAQFDENVFVYTQALSPQLISGKYEYGEKDAVVSYQKQWDLRANLTRGDCGMVLYDIQNAATPILGMYTHTYSGSGGRAQRCEPITEEMLASLSISQDSAVYTLDKLVDFEKDPKINLELGVCRYMGYREPTRLSEKSGFLPSPLVGDFSFAKEPVKFPSILSPKDDRCPKGVTPLTKAGSKYREIMKPFDERDIRYVAGFQLHRWLLLDPKITVKIRSWTSALTGIKGVPEFKQISLSSAPGPSHIEYRPAGQLGKGWMFTRNDDDTITLSDPRAIERAISLMREILYCKKVPFLFTMSLKSELLKSKKILEANTRGFSISDYEYVVFCKMFFMDMAKFMTDHHDKQPYSIGVTVEGTDFHNTISNATKYGRSGFDGDAVEWDGRVSAQPCTYAVENYSKWYSHHLRDQCLEAKFDDDFFTDPIISQAIDKDEFLRFVDNLGFDVWLKTVHMNLMEQCMFSHQQVYDIVYRTCGGMPSGHFLTAVLNSHANEIKCNTALVSIAKRERNFMPTYDDLLQVGQLYYGDDNIILPSGKLEFVTGDDFKEFFLEHNMLYTPADKSDTFGPNRDITEMEFLKRDIYEKDGKFMGRMQMATINSLLNWYQISKVSGMNEVETLFVRWQDALKYLYFYEDESLYEEARSKCNAYLKSQGSNQMLMDKPGIYAQFFAEHFVDDIEQHSNVDVSNYGARLTHNQVTTTAGPTYKTPVIKRREPEGKIESEPIEYSRVTGKWYQVDTYDWTNAAVPDTIIQSWRIPDQLITNQQLLQPFVNMKYWRGDIELKFQINGTRFHQGLLVAAFLPMGDLSVPKMNDVREMTQVQHGFIQPQENATLTMKIPFRHCVNYIDTDKFTQIEGNLGFVRLMVASQLRNSTNASTSIPITVSVRFTDSEFHLQKPLVFQNGGSSSKSSKGDTEITYNYYIGGGGNTVQNETGGDQYDLEASTATEVSPDMNYGSTNMDSVNIGIQPYPIVNRAFPVINNANNIFLNNRMTLYPQETAPTKKSHFNVDEDEMDINYIVEKPVFNERLTWNSSDVKGTLLSSGQITPAMWSCNYRTPSGSGSGTYGSIPYTDVVTSMFKFWRGNICTHIKIVASPFATGRLLFTPMYGDYTESAALSEADSQAFEIIDLGENKREFNFEWNFPSFMERKYCTNTSMTKISNDFRDLYSLGSFYLYVQAPYTVGEGIPTQCEILVFHYLKDMRYSYFQPGAVLPNTLDTTTVTTPAEAIVEQNAGVEEGVPASDNPEVEHDTHLLGSGPKVSTMTSGLKPTKNLKDILKKFVSLQPLATSVTAGTTFVDIGRIYELTGLALVFGLYMWRRGGTRVVLGQSGFMEGSRYLTFYPGFRGTPSTIVGDNAIQPYNERLLNDSQCFVQAESSFTMPYNFLLNLMYHSTDDLSVESLFGNSVNGSNLQPQFFTEGTFAFTWANLNPGTLSRFWQQWTFAGADDVRFGGLVGYSSCTVFDLDANI